ncbi:MAG: hypothetical protein JO000_25665 [Alphaproteobacteria bacterium]|nr:hypothetical protein [Alphaproteobacteria bacterium]
MSRDKRGRPAVAGARYPSGERREARDPRSENVFRRFAELEQTVGLDPRLTSQVGRLRYLKLITEAQAAAADKLAQIYGRFERTHRVRRFSVSPSYELGRGRSTHDHADADIAAATDDYRAVQECIPSFPRDTRELIEQLCVENCAVPSLRLPDICRVLDRIARLFGIAGAPAEERAGVAASGPRRRARGAPPTKEAPPRQTRQEKFEAGAYAVRAENATPLPSRFHAEGSQAAHDHAALVRRLEQAQRAREE